MRFVWFVFKNLWNLWDLNSLLKLIFWDFLQDFCGISGRRPSHFVLWWVFPVFVFTSPRTFATEPNLAVSRFFTNGCIFPLHYRLICLDAGRVSTGLSMSDATQKNFHGSIDARWRYRTPIAVPKVFHIAIGLRWPHQKDSKPLSDSDRPEKSFPRRYRYPIDPKKVFHAAIGIR